MDIKTFKALLKLNNNFKCRCGAKYQLLSIIKANPPYYLLKVFHNHDYVAIEIYNLKTNKMMTDGMTENPQETTADMWENIKKQRLII